MMTLIALIATFVTDHKIVSFGLILAGHSPALRAAAYVAAFATGLILPWGIVDDFEGRPAPAGGAGEAGL